MKRKVLASFGENHEGLGHISRLIAIKNSALNQFNIEPIFFVEHQQYLIEDYKLNQFILPSYDGSLKSDDWANGISKLDHSYNKNGKEIADFMVGNLLNQGEGILLYDVVIHNTLYEWGVKANWQQALVYRERKDINNPIDWVKKNAPAVKTIFYVGKPTIRETDGDYQLIGVNNIVRKRVSEDSIWNLSDKNDEFKIVITAGGGGHWNAKEFLQSAINSINEVSKKIERSIHLYIITGPFYNQSVIVPKDFCGKVTFRSYLSATYSFYKDSSLIICQGGYNTFNEVAKENIPVILVPAERKLDDQLKRIQEGLERLSPMAKITGGSLNDFSNKIFGILESITRNITQQSIIENDVNGADEVAYMLNKLIK